MVQIVKRGAAALALVLALSVPADAQLLPNSYLTGVNCADGYAGFVGSWTSLQCSGAFSGNNNGRSDPGEEATIDHIDTLWGLNIVGDGWDTNGSGLVGDFVIAIKASRSFSLYYFEGVTALDIDYGAVTAGVSLNGQDINQAESHTTYYDVPEPGSLMLLAGGFLGLAVIRRREKLI